MWVFMVCHKCRIVFHGLLIIFLGDNALKNPLLQGVLKDNLNALYEYDSEALSKIWRFVCKKYQ